jgi:hypothetical protein
VPKTSSPFFPSGSSSSSFTFPKNIFSYFVVSRTP